VHTAGGWRHPRHADRLVERNVPGSPCARANLVSQGVRWGANFK
jgi:hypothetical protein